MSWLSLISRRTQPLRLSTVATRVNLLVPLTYTRPYHICPCMCMRMNVFICKNMRERRKVKLIRAYVRWKKRQFGQERCLITGYSCERSQPAMGGSASGAHMSTMVREIMNRFGRSLFWKKLDARLGPMPVVKIEKTGDNSSSGA